MFSWLQYFESFDSPAKLKQVYLDGILCIGFRSSDDVLAHFHHREVFLFHKVQMSPMACSK